MEWPKPRNARGDAYDDDDDSSEYSQGENLPQSRYVRPSSARMFPPHPSVRVPPQVKTGRQIPPGVGTVPPPTSYKSPSLYSQAPARTPPSGQLVQDFRFPQIPPPIPSTQSKFKDGSGRKYNMHESYVSSIQDDSTTPAVTPRTTSSVHRNFSLPRKSSSDEYTEAQLKELVAEDEKAGALGYSGSPNTPPVIRQASLGRRAKPEIKNVRSWASDRRESSDGSDHPSTTPGSRISTVNALSKAVAAGLTNRQDHSLINNNQELRNPNSIRMPFDVSPPSSPELPRATPAGSKPRKSSNASHTPVSAKSSNTLLGLGIEQPSMSDRIPASKRPPRLDMDAVREAEARGSTTSLADLIRRATRLASNLDRGKTASRLGMLDMFGSSEKLGQPKRDSEMSHIISAFPAPGTAGTPRLENTYMNEKGFFDTIEAIKAEKQPKKRRKVCGLRVPALIAVLITLTILIAAAILIPIFLILVPNQNRNADSQSLSNCGSTHPCQNGGTSIVSNNQCACICSNGFTSNQCATLDTTESCTTMTMSDGSHNYKNATLGSSLMPTFSNQADIFGVPLNASTILAIFSSNNLSCVSENSMVDFNSSTTKTPSKRFIIIPESSVEERVQSPDFVRGEAIKGEHLPGKMIKRDDSFSTVGTSNGIVFQATTTAEVAAATNTAAMSTVLSVAPSSTPSPTLSATNSTSAPTDQQVEFARVVIMYVLEQSGTISMAVNARQKVQEYFSVLNATSANSTVDVGFGSLELTADFSDFSISGTGGRVGGKAGA